MKKVFHKLLGSSFTGFKWYRRWQGGHWTLVYIKSVNIYIWVKDYQGLSQCEIIKEENWG